MESLKNIFAVSELRNRVLSRWRCWAVPGWTPHPDAGVNPRRCRSWRQMQNTMFGLYDMFSGGSLSRVTIFAWASCLHQRVDHPAAAHVVWPYSRSCRKRASWGAANHASTRATGRSC